MTLAARAPGTRRRLRVRVEGTVQGVGFRPFVFRLAEELGLAGWVRNDEHGVLLEAEGQVAAVEELLLRLRTEAPALAELESVGVTELATAEGVGFQIVESRSRGEPDAAVSPDVATCEQCLAEVLDPAGRRYRYPFTNCTDCGPRFTIIRGVPYDRPQTTMAGFEMCERCRAEYDDPRDRRFHAQPNACPRCGPRVRLTDAEGKEAALAGHRDAIEAAAARLRSGAIVAVKGLGGYHLACRADDERAVSALRARKRREERPFALMAADLASARRLVELSAGDAEVLGGPARPIVIAPRLPGADVAPAVAPQSADLGVMLPYSALHHLLLADTGTTLVMTSGNLSDEPIAYDDDDARCRLGGVADLFLAHDRPIHTRADDSVVRSVAFLGPLVIRRSRGMAPRALDLPAPASPPVLGCGAELKNTFCLAKGRRAWVGHHIGDLRNWETLDSFRTGIEHFANLFAARPEVVAHDLHPDYLSSRHAGELDGVELVGVQHHHAHLAACLAEHGERGPAVGAILDGAGYGSDGTIWGGELLLGDAAAFERVGMLFPVRQPGGDAATREPWRMACAWSLAAFGPGAPVPPALRDRVSESRWASVAALASGGVGAPTTTSAGRLFDAIAALCGVRASVSYEGQAAAELEGIADRGERSNYPLPWSGGGDDADPLVLDARKTVRAIVEDLDRGVPVEVVAARFHNALAVAIAAACMVVAGRAGVRKVVLSGGVFQNRLLLERTLEHLRGAGLRTLVPELLPPNDGGISYGQVAVAVARRAARGER